MDAKYQQDGLTDSRSFSAQNLWVLTVEAAPVQVHVYALPWAQAISSGKTDSSQAFSLGLDTEINF